MYILGISGGFKEGYQDSAACIIKNNEIIAAAEEERFSRVKHSPSELPINAIKFCLKYAGISMKDVDKIAYPFTWSYAYKRLEDYMNFYFGTCPEINLINHHIAHAASAYRISGFPEANIITTDFSGDGISALLCYAEGNGKINVLDTYKKPNSLGIFYTVLTQVLGFRRDSDEYKVMGLSSYGKPTIDLSWLLKLTDKGYELNADYLIKEIPDMPKTPTAQERSYNSNLLEKLKPRLKEEPITKYHEDLAASGQKLLEEAALRLLKTLTSQTGSRNLCIAGGVGLNCVMNQRLRESGLIDHIYVPPGASDSGLAIGSALEVATSNGFEFGRLHSPYLGPEYSNIEIKAALDMFKVNYHYAKDPAKLAAAKISEGKIIGWFQGKEEFGPRALGNRSILADPRSPDMKDKVNETIKFREEFRPFAPSILYENASDFFANAYESPYMTLTFDVKEDRKKTIPAVTHVDGTARVQTVKREENPLYYDLIKEFFKLTNVPVVLNTSFNIKGEPIVNKPQQAVATFFGSGMDCLFIGNYFLEK